MAAVSSDPEGDDATNVRDALIDNIASKYPLDDDGHPEVSSRVDTMMIHAQQVEENFFKPVDGWAAEALTLLEGGSRNLRWSNHNRSAWARFLISLMLRCPEDIEHLRAIWYEDFKATDDESEARYANSREHDDPPTFAEFLASQPVVTFEKSLFEVYFSLVDNKSVGGVINHMRWRVIDTSDTGLELPTSDRPVIRSPNLKAPDGHIALPIGPTRLFVAAAQPSTIESILKASRRALVKESNPAGGWWGKALRIRHQGQPACVCTEVVRNKATASHHEADCRRTQETERN